MPAGVGVVDTIGPDTKTDLKEGDRVIGQPWGSGTWQQYVAVDASQLVSTSEGGIRLANA